MKFKVGDKIKGLSDTYGITNTDMDLGEVKEVAEKFIKILVLEHKDSMEIGHVYTSYFPEGKFEIVENLTISQLQSEIDKLSNKVSKEYSNVISNRDKVNYLKEQLKELIKESKKEENKPILDDVEREYLKNVIKPFKNKVNGIRKGSSGGGEFIHIGIIDEMGIFLPNFKKNTMYKGMEAGKEYTLKELSLDE